MDFYLGVDFTKAISTAHNPDPNKLFIRAAGKSVDLEVALIQDTDGPQLAAIGFEGMYHDQRYLNEIVAKALRDTQGQPLRCTTWIEYAIDVGSVRPVKRKYYPVSCKREEEMFAQVLEILETRMIESSMSVGQVR